METIFEGQDPYLSALAKLANTFDAATGKPTDPYKAFAAIQFNVPEDQVTDHQRQWIKNEASRRAYR